MKPFSPITRRDFLKRAALAGAAPFLLPSGLRAATAAPSNQITLGFIGLGKQGRYLLENCLKRDTVRVLAVCDVDTTRRHWSKKAVEDAYADKLGTGAYKGCDAFNDFRELTARKDIDAVVIATPDHWHAFIAITAAHEGKDIYCEKPVSHTVLEGRAMVNAARRKKRIFQVGSMQRSMSEFLNACELVRNGVIGDIKSVDVCVDGPPKPCDLPADEAEPGLDWDLWLGGAPVRPYNSILSPRGVYDNFPNWRSYKEYGSGGIGDWGAHHFDIVQWALGMDTTGPVEFTPPVDPHADHGMRFRYANGVEVTQKSGEGITFYGSAGKIYVNRGKFKFWLGDTLLCEEAKQSGQVAKEHLPANAVHLYKSSNHISDWITAMQKRQTPICDIETGHRTATICELINASYWHDQHLLWNPAKERFEGGAGDPKWLGQEYRKPWKTA